MYNPPDVMLASSKMPSRDTDPSKWLIQPKLDGVRALIVKENGVVRVFGRNYNKDGSRAEFTQSVPEIASWFRPLAQDCILDCELMSSNFSRLITKVRTTREVIVDPEFCVIVHDVLAARGVSVMDLPTISRVEIAEDYIDKFGIGRLFNVKSTCNLAGWSVVNNKLNNIVKAGGEGLIIKHLDGLYTPGKRSPHIVKVLPYREMDVVFTGRIEGVGKHTGMLGALCASSGDVNFKVGTGFTDAQRKEIHALPESFFPAKGKISFKNIIEDSGKPRMPVFLQFKED